VQHREHLGDELGDVCLEFVFERRGHLPDEVQDLRLERALRPELVDEEQHLGEIGANVLLHNGDQDAELLEEEVTEALLRGLEECEDRAHDAREERHALEPERAEDEHHRLRQDALWGCKEVEGERIHTH